MPANIRDAQTAGTGVNDWFNALPPISRTHATLCFLVTLGVSFKFISPYSLILHWPLVLKRFEIWRLFTNFFLLGKFSFPFVFYMIWILTYGVALERETYQFDPAGLLYMYLFCCSAMLALAIFFPGLGLAVNSISLVYTLVYVWSRNFPDQVVKIMGLVSIQSFYLPFAFVAVQLLFGESPVPGLVGIAVAHLYWFLKELYPISSGRDPLATPGWLKRFSFRQLGLGANPTPTVPHVSGFQAFRGGGRRLGTS